jgi:hypothetical protein
MTVVYYAHSMQIYGTPEAAKAKAAISLLIPDGRIFDPETLDWKRLAKEHGQAKVFESVILQSDRVVVYEHQGHIGRGVAEEIWRAQNHKRPLHVLRGLDTEPVLIPIKSWTRAPGNDWKIRYGYILT